MYEIVLIFKGIQFYARYSVGVVLIRRRMSRKYDAVYYRSTWLLGSAFADTAEVTPTAASSLYLPISNSEASHQHSRLKRQQILQASASNMDTSTTTLSSAALSLFIYKAPLRTSESSL